MTLIRAERHETFTLFTGGLIGTLHLTEWSSDDHIVTPFQFLIFRMLGFQSAFQFAIPMLQL